MTDELRLRCPKCNKLRKGFKHVRGPCFYTTECIGFTFKCLEYGSLYGHPEFVDDDEGEMITMHFAKEIAADYVRRLSEVITTLALMEGRSQLDIFIDMGGDLYRN